MTEWVWIVCHGQQTDEYEFSGGPINVFDAKTVTLSDIEDMYITDNELGNYERVEDAWECDEYIWLDHSDGSCYVANKMRLRQNV